MTMDVPSIDAQVLSVRTAPQTPELALADWTDDFM
jgi:hypothetical protein